MKKDGCGGDEATLAAAYFSMSQTFIPATNLCQVMPLLTGAYFFCIRDLFFDRVYWKVVLPTGNATQFTIKKRQ